ncbi:unnamed protein product [Adineta steineri]|uniref:Tetraspanin n=1 Tax=Adineta steineri TaxID=433720 RepID=A0A818QSW8_9BILA|nr:unnamed protein product [Adineta steineri]CAF0817166.1 unnamed protein product [Adineta steineri]CAF3645862.1 unnamed protein product [Adineta steineri]
MGRELSCGVEFMRGILLFFNVLFVIVGLALIGLGIYIKVDDNFASILEELANGQKTFEGQSLGFLAFVMIGGGVFTLLIALFGCMGALWNNRCLLYMYALILALLMILELVGFIMAFVNKGNLEKVYKDSLSKALKDAVAKNETGVLTSFHRLEGILECCGAQNISDYGDYPQSLLSEQCKKDPTPQGCSDAIIGLLKKYLGIIGGSLGGVLLLELLGLIGAIVLAKALKNKPDNIVVRGPRRR